MQQAGHPLAHKPFLPAPYARFRDPSSAHDLGGATALGRRQNAPRPPHMLLWAVAIRHHRRQSLTVGGTHFNTDPLAHAAVSHAPLDNGILSLRRTTSMPFPNCRTYGSGNGVDLVMPSMDHRVAV